MADLPALARLADTLLDEGLAPYIASHRAAGKSWEWIARQIWADTKGDVDATGTTVQSWADRLQVSEGSA